MDMVWILLAWLWCMIKVYDGQRDYGHLEK